MRKTLPLGVECANYINEEKPPVLEITGQQEKPVLAKAFSKPLGPLGHFALRAPSRCRVWCVGADFGVMQIQRHFDVKNNPQPAPRGVYRGFCS